MKHWLATIAAAGLAAMTAAAPAPAIAAGGDLDVALGSRLSHPDPHMNSSQPDRNVSLHIFESLMALDEGSLPQPQLAESVDVSDDGLTYTFKLREGVLFHDGSTMDSADVLASYERYRAISPGKGRLNAVEEMSAPDPMTFVMKLAEPQPLFLEQISLPQYQLAILPEADSGTEARGNSGIGTGPFRFVENVTDSHVRLERFDDYSVNEAYDGPSGYGGKRTVDLDSVTFRVVVEAAARTAGVQAGDYEVADNIPVQSANRLASDASIQVIDVIPYAKVFVIVHADRAPTDNVLIRRAVQALLDAPSTLEVAMEGFYQLDGSFLFQQNAYHPDEVTPLYNQNNAEKAKALLQEAGYNGEPVTIMTNSNYDFMENTALVLQQQLTELGVNVEMQMVDWPTNVARRGDGTGGWNITVSSSTAQGPQTYFSLFKGYSHFEEDAVLDEAIARARGAATFEARKAAWKEVEDRVAEQAYMLPLGNRGRKAIASNSVKGLTPFEILRFWNVSLEQ